MLAVCLLPYHQRRLRATGFVLISGMATASI
jgi:hypothetical protein